MTKKAGLAALLVLNLAAGACGGGDGAESETASGRPGPSAETGAFKPSDFSATITHPLFPLSSFRMIEFTGSKRTDGGTVPTRVESRLLDKAETVAGVKVAVAEVKDYEGGQLVELTEDYFAQHRDGSVWYFGERVTDYKDGKVVGHGGQWLAGEGANKPGLFMPATPALGQQFAPEQVPGVADERSTVVELGVEVTVPAGKFTDCVKIEDLDLLDNDREFKFYCPRVGLVRQEGSSGGVELVRLG